MLLATYDDMTEFHHLAAAPARCVCFILIDTQPSCQALPNGHLDYTVFRLSSS